MLEIGFKDGRISTYNDSEYTDYKYDKKYFIVVNDRQWIGLYNLDCLEYVEYIND